MNWKKQIGMVCLLAVLLAPATAFAVPLGTYVQAASDPDRQGKMLNDAYDTAVARTLAGLRVEHFADGREKTPQRIARDRKLADVVEDLAAHMSDDQSGALIVIIDQYAHAQPNTELEDVIIGFLLTEGKKKLGEGQ
jgi:hypothetical protein